MKKIIMLTAMLALCATAWAKDLKTVVFTTTPQMHCAACEKVIKGNLRFEKGVQQIETNIQEQTVTVTYDADKTTPEKIQEGFKKFKYEARQLKPGEKVEVNTQESCDLM